MKVVILIAGVGRRFGGNQATRNHKALVKLDDYTLLDHLINNFIIAGVTEFIPIVGHCSEEIISRFKERCPESITINPIYNEFYSSRNNLYTLFCSRGVVDGKDFILCNGDMVFDYEIIEKLTAMNNVSAIAIDDYEYKGPVDSPGVVLNGDKISDLGRHIPFEQNEGYAIGLYSFRSELSTAFFIEAEKSLAEDMNAGFHDPLVSLFNKHSIYKCSTENLLWTDIDDQSDIQKAKWINSQITEKYV
ncbi:NTP transferase domain-containing protein [Candidatus Pseudothioglobus sp. Uisw_050_01]|uniref:phosphocholine cytidylyltransferase family protein n=1 Tax=Candidatus Pseudothioglobus sp. Uisw_050_01 TaxID=3230997 RepID=UPI003A874FBA